MNVRRYRANEIDSVLEQIKNRLKKQRNNDDTGVMELEEREEAIILKFKSKKSIDEKLTVLNQLAGSGLQHGKDFIEDAISTANRSKEALI